MTTLTLVFELEESSIKVPGESYLLIGTAYMNLLCEAVNEMLPRGYTAVGVQDTATLRTL